MPRKQAACIAVFAKHKSKTDQPLWQGVAELLKKDGYEVLICDSALPESARARLKATENPAFTYASIEEIRKKAKYAVITGGDGTFLGIARELAGANIPLVGINQGRLGFLTDIRFDDINPTLLDTLKSDGVIENRQYIEGQVIRDGEVISNHIALNDIVISRGIVGGMVDLRVEVDGHFMYDLRADGLIISTPTGSTAYSLSADGPILHPSLAGLVIVPVAPHALTNRPIALPDHCTIDVTITGGKQTAVHYDMQTNCRTKLGDDIRIRVAPKPIQLLHPARYDYFSMLRQKLHWSTAPTHATPHNRGLRDSSNAK